MEYYKKSVNETVGELNTNIEKGLSKEEAAKRLIKYGPNQIIEKKGTTVPGLIIEQFNDIIIWILLGAVIIAGIKGDIVDVIAILTILIVNAFFGFIQTYKAEKALDALKKMAALKAMVLRGKPVEINAIELVPGDVLLIESGDKIPADCRLIESVNLSINESALTGESKSVSKTIEAITTAESLGDQKNIVFSGTTVARGRAKAIVIKTGEKTEFGKIASLVQQPDEKTPLQNELKKTGFIIAIVVIVISLVVFLAGFFKGYDITLMLLASISLAVAAVPEGLPAIITVTLALGVQNMAKKHSVVRRLHAVETLGSTNYICSDKTGTITLNKMEVKKIYASGKLMPFNIGKAQCTCEEDKLLMKIMALANDVQIKELDSFAGDPTEIALAEAAFKSGFSKRDLEKENPRLDEIPFESERKMMSSINREPDSIKAYSKGAAEVILSKCIKIMNNGEIKEISEGEKEKLIKASEDLASKGYRVLGFSYRDLDENYDINSIEKNMVFVGLSAMIDPPRPEVKASIQEAMDAGIQVCMITGDHVNTATSIANEVGLLNGRRVLSGEQLSKMDVEQLMEIVEDVGVYARVNPIDKVKIVEALKKRGHIVAMTGDGVNDAPALKRADIGVSMGITGTDVAKESSDMILTDDNFATIISAVHEGRVVYDNLKKFINFLLSINVSIVAALFVGIIIMPAGAIPLLPVQILWINLVTNGLPALALGVDPPSPGIMKRKPRFEEEGILAKNSRKKIIIEGLILSLAALCVFIIGLFWLNLEVIKIQTLLFTALVIFQLAHAYNYRFFDISIFNKNIFKNRYLNYAVIGSLILQLIIVYVPALNPIFKTTALSGLEWLIIMIALAVVVIINDRVKIALT